MSDTTAAASLGRQRAERRDNATHKLPDGRWRARPTLGVDPATGRQVRVSATFRTKGDATRWIAEQRRAFDQGTYAARSGRTFAEAADHWLTVREADPDVRANTIRADRDSLRYALRAFGDTPVQKLTPAALVSWSIGLTTIAGRPLGHDTKRRAVGTLKQVTAHAVAMRWLGADPAASLRPPRQRTPAATVDGGEQVAEGADQGDAAASAGIWSPAQMDAFAEHVNGHRLAGCFALALLGLRREEVGGLRWSDVDLDAGTVSVVRARVDVNGVDRVEPPKTARSSRVLPVPARELATLRAMRTAHQRERLRIGSPLRPGDYLLSRADGSPTPVRDFTREFVRQRAAAGLPPITLRNVRHSSVSRMRERGVGADVVACWHGHDERMTTRVYSRVTDDRLAAAAAALSG